MTGDRDCDCEFRIADRGMRIGVRSVTVRDSGERNGLASSYLTCSCFVAVVELRNAKTS